MVTIAKDYNDRNITYNLYINEIIKAEKDNNQEVRPKFQERVRQGCNFSPTLFDLNKEKILKEVKIKNIEGVKIGGMLVQYLRFLMLFW